MSKCDSKKYSSHGFIDRSDLPPLALLSDDPWVAVVETITCASCNKVISGHLALRYGGISFEEAKIEWKKKYRDHTTNIKIKYL